MAARNTFELNVYKPSVRRTANAKIFLIAAACVLTAAIAVSAILLLGSNQTALRIVDFGAAIKGVCVGGIDISGQTYEQAMEATVKLEPDLLATVKISLDVAGKTLEYSAEDFNVTTDYRDIMAQALGYGHWGTFDERSAAAKTALSEGVKYDIKLIIDESALRSKLAELKSELDTVPQDATVTFTPWGHTMDGKPYTPDIQTLKEISDTQAHGKEYEGYPDLARVEDEAMPCLMRYEYYKNDHFESGYDASKDMFVTGYRPPDANISRFVYTPDVLGITVDTEAIADQIASEVKSGDFSLITVPCELIQPSVTLARIQQDTQLITSWTSSFSMKSHYNYNRNYNVSMMSCLINGAVIEPGQQWTVNKAAGYRNATTAKKYGWKMAAGLEEAGTTQQYGGGVCQLGSTTYNAALRSGLTIADFRHHTVPSDYEPVGLDATLSSPSPDLALQNDGASPYYIVSYVNPGEKNVTVEIYGPPLTDPDHPEWGNVIYTYTSKETGRFGTPASKVIECTVPTAAPDDVMIDGVTCFEYQFGSNKKGTTARVWRLIYSLDGTPLDKSVYADKEVYPVRNSTLYKWAGPMPSPTPGPSTVSPSPAAAQ